MAASSLCLLVAHRNRCNIDTLSRALEKSRDRLSVKGEEWLNRHLKNADKTKTAVVNALFDRNIATIIELYDDSFGEHVLPYSKQMTGLHLNKLGKTGKWRGEAVGGFVVQTTISDREHQLVQTYRGTRGEQITDKKELSTPPPYGPSFTFFKIKFEEPYLMYREWREATKRMLSAADKGQFDATKLSASKLIESRSRATTTLGPLCPAQISQRFDVQKYIGIPTYYNARRELIQTATDALSRRFGICVDGCEHDTSPWCLACKVHFVCSRCTINASSRQYEFSNSELLEPGPSFDPSQVPRAVAFTPYPLPSVENIAGFGVPTLPHGQGFESFPMGHSDPSQRFPDPAARPRGGSTPEIDPRLANPLPRPPRTSEDDPESGYERDFWPYDSVWDPNRSMRGTGKARDRGDRDRTHGKQQRSTWDRRRLPSEWQDEAHIGRYVAADEVPSFSSASSRHVFEYGDSPPAYPLYEHGVLDSGMPRKSSYANLRSMK
ncbi:hypothetical protein FRC12_001521 [Ceratobasidium sp. 428]|nr:hypothetical protein FRC12_001521 [Ceratobasidium sp. 428]